MENFANRWNFHFIVLVYATGAKVIFWPLFFQNIYYLQPLLLFVRPSSFCLHCTEKNGLYQIIEKGGGVYCMYKNKRKPLWQIVSSNQADIERRLSALFCRYISSKKMYMVQCNKFISFFSEITIKTFFFFLPWEEKKRKLCSLYPNSSLQKVHCETLEVYHSYP